MVNKEKKNSIRKNAVIAGALFISATAAGILSVVILGPLLDDPNHLIISVNANQVTIAALLELFMAVVIGSIAVVLFPILKKQKSSIAIGYVAARIFEAVPVIIAAIILLSLLAYSQEFAQAGVPDASIYQSTSTLLLATREWSDLIGTQIFFSLTALILNYSLYQSRLVPRFISIWGLIGAILILAAGLLSLFGLISPFSTIAIILYLPIALQEMVFAVWLIVKGFNSPAHASPSA